MRARMLIGDVRWDSIMKKYSLEEFYEIERIFYDSIAESHVEIQTQKPFLEKHIWTYEKNLLGDIQGKKILDLGCGFGREAVLFAKEGAVVTGIDLSDKSIQKAKDLALKMGVSVTFKVANVDLLDFKDEFDIVFCRASLHHFPNPNKTLKACYRFLKRGGIMVAQEPKMENPVAIIGRAFFIAGTKTERPFRTGELERMFKKVFKNFKVKYFCILSPLANIFQDLLRNEKIQNVSFSILNMLDEAVLLIPLMRNMAWIEVVYGKKLK